jgi:hypothetical protein
MGGTLIIRPGSRVGGCKYCSQGRGKHDLRTGSGRARCWVSEGTADTAAFSAGPGKNLLRRVVTGGWSLFENCTVDASICGQVFKGARWMPWHQEPMKDVGGHDSPRGAVNQALIRGFPNGETRQSSWAVTHT